jgi:hypothetical protein
MGASWGEGAPCRLTGNKPTSYSSTEKAYFTLTKKFVNHYFVKNKLSKVPIFDVISGYFYVSYYYF